MKRLNPWKLIAVGVAAFFVFLAPLIWLAALLRIPQWITGPIFMFCWILLLGVLGRQTRKGRFQWLVRRGIQAANRQ
jgi:hypothetical protein